jgi:hypothetical protein
MITDEDTRIRAIAGHLASQIHDESVVLDLGQGKYYALNSVGARSWAIIQSAHSIGEVVDQIVAQYHVSRADCLRDVLAFAQSLADFGLIEIEPE